MGVRQRAVHRVQYKETKQQQDKEAEQERNIKGLGRKMEKSEYQRKKEEGRGE